MAATKFSIAGSGWTGSSWQCIGDVQGSTGASPSSFGIGDVIFDNGTLGVRRFKISAINGISGPQLDCQVLWDDSGSSPSTGNGPKSGSGAICNVSNISRIAEVPNLTLGEISETLQVAIGNINGNYSLDSNVGRNTVIQGRSGFSSHELDGANNDVNSFIEWSATDQTTYHRVAPQQDGQDIDIKIGFQFPSYFTGLRNTGNALEFYGKADDGSGDGVNYLELIALINTDGTEYPVTGKQITASGRTMLTLSKSEVDNILNPTPASSSSSSSTPYREWDADDAGKIVYAQFKLFGNISDNIYLDQDSAFLYLE